MPNMIPALIGFSCLAPGVSIAAIGGVGLQPVLPLFAIYWIAFPLWALRIPAQPMLWSAANVIGFVLASAFAARSATGASYTAFQSLYVAVAGLLANPLIFPDWGIGAIGSHR